MPIPESGANARSREVTTLIARMSDGDVEASGELYDKLHGELRGLAERHFGRGRDRGHTLQPTALVHESWLRLVGAGTDYAGREHFLAVAARAMRSVLVDHARRKTAAKRYGELKRIAIEEAEPLLDDGSPDFIELDDALCRLAQRSSRRAKVVELRFFGGLTIQETATALDASTATVQREWQLARLWLLSEMDPGQPKR